MNSYLKIYEILTYIHVASRFREGCFEIERVAYRGNRPVKNSPVIRVPARDPVIGDAGIPTRWWGSVPACGKSGSVSCFGVLSGATTTMVVVVVVMVMGDGGSEEDWCARRAGERGAQSTITHRTCKSRKLRRLSVNDGRRRCSSRSLTVWFMRHSTDLVTSTRHRRSPSRHPRETGDALPLSERSLEKNHAKAKLMEKVSHVSDLSVKSKAKRMTYRTLQEH